MKKALIIGGTKTFGKEIALAFTDHGFSVDTIGRTRPDFDLHLYYQCDIANRNKRKELFMQLLNQNQYDTICCVVGYARQQSHSDSTLSEELNINYVKDVLDLRPTSDIITIGSQWSIRKGNESLRDYIKVKHELKRLTIQYKHGRANHYCVPTMQTKQYEQVLESFKNTGCKLQHVNNVIQHPKDIARTLVSYDIKHKPQGKVLWIPKKNIIEVL